MQKKRGRTGQAMPQGRADKEQATHMKGLTFYGKTLLSAVLINMLFTGIFCFYSYQACRSCLMRDIDDRLLSSVHAVRYILPEGFHGRISSRDSVLPEEHLANVKRLSSYAEYSGVTYLYTMMKDDGRVVFTSTSATDEELGKGSFHPFYAEYKGATPRLEDAFSGHRVIFGESHDRYGDFRSVIVPVVMPSGKVYAMGADLDIRFIRETLNRVLAETLLICALVFFITLGLVTLVLRGFRVSMARLREDMDRVAGTRDLAVAMDVSYGGEAGDISRRVHGLTGMLRGMVLQMRDAAGTITGTCRGMVSESETLASHTQDQYDVMAETSYGLEALGAEMVRKSENITAVENEMKAFNDAVQERIGLLPVMNESMRQIDSSISQMEHTVSAMKEMAFQADLLALNASVEADRAGMKGEGFGVVAEEVGNLARKAEEISRDIDHAFRKNLEATRNGSDLVAQAAEFFSEVTGKISEIKDRISDIAEEFREQVSGIEYMEDAVSRTRDILERNTDLAGRISESYRELKAELDVLSSIMAGIKVD